MQAIVFWRRCIERSSIKSKRFAVCSIFNSKKKLTLALEELKKAGFNEQDLDVVSSDQGAGFFKFTQITAAHRNATRGFFIGALLSGASYLITGQSLLKGLIVENYIHALIYNLSLGALVGWLVFFTLAFKQKAYQLTFNQKNDEFKPNHLLVVMTDKSGRKKALTLLKKKSSKTKEVDKKSLDELAL